MADQTNAEVSDERLRELAARIRRELSILADLQAARDEDGMKLLLSEVADALERRSVTSQASEGAGWKLVPVEPTGEMYGPKDAPTSFAYFVRFNDFYHSYKAMIAAAPASPSKRVERLETAELIGGQSLSHIAELATMLRGLTVGQPVTVSSQFHEAAMVLQALQGGRPS